MKLTVFLSDDSEIEIRNFESSSALDLKAELNDKDGDQFITFDLDAQSVSGWTAIINRDHITRIDIEGS